MGELGELLELLHGADRSFQTAVAEFRVWAAAGHESRIRIWFEPPDRIREEREGDLAATLRVGVRAGDRWWTYSDHLGAITNEAPNEGHGIGTMLQFFFQPWPLASVLRMELVGRGRQADRPTWRVLAKPLADGNPDMHLGVRFRLHSLAGEADDYLLDVDQERGLILRVEARRHGEAVQIHEATELVLDAPIDPERFVFEPPEGEEVQTFRDLAPDVSQLPLHEAVGKVPFTVYVPARVPDNWRLRASVFAARERPPIPAWITVWYSTEDASGEVHISETKIDDDHWRTITQSDDWHEIETGSGTTRAFRGPNDVEQALVMRRMGDTRVTLSSQSVGVETLIELAEALVPASKAPPRI
ncbi:MAG: hypothetical protein QOJ38_1183 [Solirubrobacterales bacterium]|jgi:outer membrane lipoprotein-sorting protein|nr:hypothetical protein [Solirubrobacterales bacterium]